MRAGIPVGNELLYWLLELFTLAPATVLPFGPVTYPALFPLGPVAYPAEKSLKGYIFDELEFDAELELDEPVFEFDPDC